MLAERSRESIYFRGAGPSPFIYTAELGPAKFSSVAFALETEDDVRRLAASHGADVEPLDGPVGGLRVVLVDPDGFKVEAVTFAHQIASLDVRAALPTNSAHGRSRLNTELRFSPGPGQVCRIGHAVLNVTDFRRSEAWYKARFGFITSDEIIADNGRVVGAFLRCNRGGTFTDHHTLFLIEAPVARFNHAAFEVIDADHLRLGHDMLARRGYEHYWGIGRHVLGSQIFDYWKDPWGHVLEHWTDGDMMNEGWGSRRSSLDSLGATQWGPAAPHARARTQASE
ncbi:MAG: VOC family protein [Hyphomonadaceae bacterium]